MVSEFHQLFEKVSDLAGLVAALKRENADLRAQLAALCSENTELARRMQEASQRVAALLDKIPAADENEETA